MGGKKSFLGKLSPDRAGRETKMEADASKVEPSKIESHVVFVYPDDPEINRKAAEYIKKVLRTREPKWRTIEL